jgi:hypothetical protein
MKRFTGPVIFLAASSFCWGQVQTYCSEIGGNIACTSYDQGAQSQSYCTRIGGNLSCTTYSNDNYDQVRIQRDYQAGQVMGTALGNVVIAAIEAHRAKKQAREEWDQYIQDKFAEVDLGCETDPHLIAASGPSGAVGCRTVVFALNQFVHKHRKDFVADGWNINLLADAAGKLEGVPDDLTKVTEQMIERAFQGVDKKQLDKKPR